MSLCYDFQKWTIISMAAVAISLTIGLITIAYGYIDPERYRDDPELYKLLPEYNHLEQLLNYCYAHASDSDNPIQDLIDKGLITSEYPNCSFVKISFSNIDAKIGILIRAYIE